MRYYGAIGLFLCLVMVELCNGSQSVGLLPNDEDTLASSETRSTLSVESSLVGVKVFLDSIMIGLAPFQHIAMTEGVHLLRYVHPEGTNWLYPATMETIVVVPAAHVYRRVRFPKHYHITSEPHGAKVQYRDSVLGETPLYIAMHEEKELITLSRDGFSSETLLLPSDGGEVHAMLSPVAGTMPNTSLYLTDKQSKSSTPILITASATVLTGAAAAYFKIKADGFYNDYQRTGSSDALNNVHNFDAVAGVSLAASQISLLILSYLLFSR